MSRRMSGAEQWIDIEGQEKEARLKTFLALPNGIPSYNTIARVFASLDPTQFQQAFLNWIQAIKKELPGEVIAIDGKTLRGSRCFGKKRITSSQCLGNGTTSEFRPIKSK